MREYSFDPSTCSSTFVKLNPALLYWTRNHPGAGPDYVWELVDIFVLFTSNSERTKTYSHELLAVQGAPSSLLDLVRQAGTRHE